MQILRKYMDGTTKKITFENFLRALKWCEQATLDEKIRGLYSVILWYKLVHMNLSNYLELCQGWIHMLMENTSTLKPVNWSNDLMLYFFYKR